MLYSITTWSFNQQPGSSLDISACSVALMNFFIISEVQILIFSSPSSFCERNMPLVPEAAYCHADHGLNSEDCERKLWKRSIMYVLAGLKAASLSKSRKRSICHPRNHPDMAGS